LPITAMMLSLHGQACSSNFIYLADLLIALHYSYYAGYRFLFELLLPSDTCIQLLAINVQTKHRWTPKASETIRFRVCVCAKRKYAVDLAPAIILKRCQKLDAFSTNSVWCCTSCSSFIACLLFVIERRNCDLKSTNMFTANQWHDTTNVCELVLSLFQFILRYCIGVTVSGRRLYPIIYTSLFTKNGSIERKNIHYIQNTDVQKIYNKQERKQK